MDGLCCHYDCNLVPTDTRSRLHWMKPPNTLILTCSHFPLSGAICWFLDHQDQVTPKLKAVNEMNKTLGSLEDCVIWFNVLAGRTERLLLRPFALYFAWSLFKLCRSLQLELKSRFLDECSDKQRLARAFILAISSLRPRALKSCFMLRHPCVLWMQRELPPTKKRVGMKSVLRKHTLSGSRSRWSLWDHKKRTNSEMWRIRFGTYKISWHTALLCLLDLTFTLQWEMCCRCGTSFCGCSLPWSLLRSMSISTSDTGMCKWHWCWVEVRCRARRESFAQKRFWSVLFIRLGIPLVFIVFGFFVEAPVASVSAIFVVILTKSPLANVFFCSLVHRVEFRQHVFIQAIAFVESLLWIPPFCRTCASSLNVKEKLNEVRVLWKGRLLMPVCRWDMELTGSSHTHSWTRRLTLPAIHAGWLVQWWWRHWGSAFRHFWCLWLKCFRVPCLLNQESLIRLTLHCIPTQLRQSRLDFLPSWLCW